MRPIEVLLSTYNGARYLPELLESVQRQTYPEFLVSVRDDGSTDETTEITSVLADSSPRFRVLDGEHVGAGRSFLALLAQVRDTSEYAAFCDQDDIWMPNKLNRAVSLLSDETGPALYCSAVTLVDADLQRLGIYRRCTRLPGFANALVENIATGCTIVLNRKAIDLVNRASPQAFLMHDAWCYLVVSAFGKVVYDSEPHVLYRLHSSNSIGVGISRRSEWSRRWKQHRESGSARLLSQQAMEFGELYAADLPISAAGQLRDFLAAQHSLPSRLGYALMGDAYRQRRIDNFVYRILYAAHRI